MSESAPHFGTLTKLAANAVGGWTHEAHDFTPWLADNLELLGQELGLALELREHSVGRYSLDLLLEDSRRRVVIVENQFGQTDHDHLGKLLTYAAGTEADVVIWIAETLTEEHVAALEWLNDSTVEGVGFFGVVLELLRIDNSLPAPHFRVLVRPNDWVKRVRPELRPQVQWSWDSYESQLSVPTNRIDVGQSIVQRLEAEIEARGLKWRPLFNKGYVAFQRDSGYNVVLVDVYWKRAPRFAIKIPAPLDELNFPDPYPSLETSWDVSQREWGWTIPTTAEIPDLGPALDIARAFHTSSGSMTSTPAVYAQALPTASGRGLSRFADSPRHMRSWATRMRPSGRSERDPTIGASPKHKSRTAVGCFERSLLCQEAVAVCGFLSVG